MLCKASLLFDYFLLFTTLPVPAHESFHAAQGFFDLTVFGRITSADKTFSAGAKGIARHYSHAFFL